jgi:hypothetical protein
MADAAVMLYGYSSGECRYAEHIKPAKERLKYKSVTVHNIFFHLLFPPSLSTV